MVQLHCSHSESPPHLCTSPVWKEAHHIHEDVILCVRLHSLFGGAGVEKQHTKSSWEQCPLILALWEGHILTMSCNYWYLEGLQLH